MMRKKTIGIGDVARLVGVSNATVSKVFNRGGSSNTRISQETCRRVLEAAEKLGYAPNYGAALLRGAASRTIGVALSLPGEEKSYKLTDYGVRIINGLGEAAETAGYRLLLISGGEYRDYLNIKRIDALVILSYRASENPHEREMLGMFEEFNRRAYPYVVINNHVRDLPLNAIGIDNHAGMRQITELILRRDYESVGFIGELSGNPQIHHCERLADLRELPGARLRPEAVLNTFAPFPRSAPGVEADGYSGTAYLHRRNTLPRCLVCGCDNIAYGVLQYCHEAHIRIPEDLALIGFDDMPMSSYCTPSLTTVRQPLEEFGKLAFEFLLRKIEQPELSIDLNLKPVLKERNSTRETLE